jgi:hypothetical protein
MISDLRWIVRHDGARTLQMFDEGHGEWFDVPEVWPTPIEGDGQGGVNEEQANGPRKQ